MAKNNDKQVRLGDYIILTDQFVDAMGDRHRHAYAVRNEDTGNIDHFAVITGFQRPPRVKDLHKYHALQGGSAQRLSEWGKVDWPAANGQQFALIFAFANDRPFMQSMTERIDPFTTEQLADRLVNPTLYVLREMYDRGIFHGMIAPNNCYYSGSDNKKTLIGEPVSRPAGMDCPPVCLTIERAMADADGRGIGQLSDDFYALGITAAVLARGRDPLRGKTTDEIIDAKLKHGSYAAMVQGMRPNGRTSELLRGLLADQANQRWGVDELQGWLKGGRLSAKQHLVNKKAARALEFNGEKYTTVRPLARAFVRDVDAAQKIIETGGFLKWVERSLSDGDLLDRIEDAIAQAKKTGGEDQFKYRLVSYVCMEMDPAAPVRYKTRSVLPQGVGMAVYQNMINNDPIQEYAEMLSNRTLKHWLNTPGNETPWHPELERKFDLCKQLISQQRIGRGPERCLYELNENAPCLSPLLNGHYVTELDELLIALDAVCRDNNKTPDQLIDRYIAGFISARDDRDYAGVMAKLSDDDAGQRRLAELTILSIIQKRHLNDKNLPNLLKWMRPHAEKICTRFRNKERRARIIAQIPDAIKTGNLGQLMVVVDNAEEVRDDIAEFREAQADYRQMAARLDKLEYNLANDDNAGQSTGRELAVVISGVCAGLIMIATLISHLAELKDSLL